MKKSNPVEEAIEQYWGERCPDHEEGCIICDAWQAYDMLVQSAEAPHHPDCPATDGMGCRCDELPARVVHYSGR